MDNRETIRKIELDLVTERFKKMYDVTRDRNTNTTIIEPKGSTLYKVNRSLIHRQR